MHYDFFIRSKDDSREAMLQKAAQIIFNEMKVVKRTDLCPNDWLDDFDIEYLYCGFSQIARQSKDSQAAVWAGEVETTFPVETIFQEVYGPDFYKVVRRPQGLVAVGSRAESKVDPRVQVKEPVACIRGGRKIDRMSIDEILDAASKVEE